MSLPAGNLMARSEAPIRFLCSQELSWARGQAKGDQINLLSSKTETEQVRMGSEPETPPLLNKTNLENKE